MFRENMTAIKNGLTFGFTEHKNKHCKNKIWQQHVYSFVICDFQALWFLFAHQIDKSKQIMKAKF